MSLYWHHEFFAVLKSSSTKVLQEHHQSAILRRLRYKSAVLREIFGHITVKMYSDVLHRQYAHA